MPGNGDHPLTDAEVQEFEEQLMSATGSATREIRHHARWRFFWTAVYYVFGISAVVVTALAGVSGIAKDNAELAGWLAAAGAVLTAVVTFFGADKKRAAHEQQVVAYGGLLVDDCPDVASHLKLRDVTRDPMRKQMEQLREKLRQIGSKDQVLGIA